jgi:hypothetical protein
LRPFYDFIILFQFSGLQYTAAYWFIFKIRFHAVFLFIQHHFLATTQRPEKYCTESADFSAALALPLAPDLAPTLPSSPTPPDWALQSISYTIATVSIAACDMLTDRCFEGSGYSLPKLGTLHFATSMLLEKICKSPVRNTLRCS